MKVQKRNGKIVNFDITRVDNAVKKAFKSAEVELTDDVLRSVEESFNDLDNEDDTPIQVEVIQDRIEQKLYKLGYNQVARVFILYREKRREVRDWTSKKMSFIDKYKASSNTANATIDDNSNVANKNIGILNSEIHKEDNISISRRMVSEKLKQLFPDFDYKQYERDLTSHIIYKHDESSFAGAIAPYCCSITMYPFLLGGIKGIGGLSAKPKNLDSFCGMYSNLIFATSAMFAGACLYKDQTLFISKNGNIEKITSKDLITSYFDLNKDKVRKFTNWQGDWEYINVEDLNLKVYEDGFFIKINKLYRRKYNSSIYKISTKDGYVATVSKDHIFKQSINELSLEVSAENLKVGDSVVMNKNIPNGLEINNIDTEEKWFDKLGKESSIDVISSITTFKNDDEYVYEIETETHWYNCGGFITHNCATSEFLLYFDYFARKEWGDMYYQKPDVSITSPYCIRQKTIRSQIHQYFQQVIYSINQPAAARGLQSASTIRIIL